MARVVIPRAIPGGGKSFFTYNVLINQALRLIVCSADHFFMKNGVYTFNPGLLPLAHRECQKAFVGAVDDVVRSPTEHKDTVIVVDNTNLSAIEYGFYATYASMKGVDTEIVTIECPVDVAKARNTHGVPESAYPRMQAALEKGTKDIPPWWKHTVRPYVPVRAEVNQCDGCARGLPLEGNTHRNPDGSYDFIACTASRYTEVSGG